MHSFLFIIFILFVLWSTVMDLFFLKGYFHLLKREGGRERKRERDIYHSLDYFPNTYNSLSSARLRPGTQWRPKTQELKPSSVVVLGCVVRELDCKWRSRDSDLALQYGIWTSSAARQCRARLVNCLTLKQSQSLLGWIQWTGQDCVCCPWVAAATGHGVFRACGLAKAFSWGKKEK